MATPLKASFGLEKATYVAELISAVYPIDQTAFVVACSNGFEDAELMARSQLIADALAATLPSDRGRAVEVIIEALASETDRCGEIPEQRGVEPFRYLPLVQFVGQHGLDHFEASMRAQYELTQRFTAEFSIRRFLEVHTEATLERLEHWTSDPNEHVRRLVSEGTRPRLPWASRLTAFIDDPTPVIRLLDKLCDDPSEYVRRSVANNLNDISKDHPDLAIDVARRWWPAQAAAPGTVARRQLVRHALRTLVKAGDPRALEVIGYGAPVELRVTTASVDPPSPRIGGSVRVSAQLRNVGDQPAAAMIDLRVWFVKANGSTSAKVFKGTELTLDPGASGTVSKVVSVRQLSTRTHHPGRHRIDLLINGDPHHLGHFDLQA